jgi:tetratricopeptide (TPR) repeat protein
MNKRIAVLALLLVLSATVYSQDAATQKRELPEKANTLRQQEKFPEAIKAAESLVKLEKDSNDSASYADALIFLARLKRDYFLSLRDKLSGHHVAPDEIKAVSETSAQMASEAEALFRQALQLNETSGREQTAQTADLKRDLAWLIYHYPLPGTKTIEQSRARIDEAEKLFQDSIALNDQVRGKDADETLFDALDVGDFYFHYANFEKALPFYERFIQTYEQKHGTNHPDLVRALLPYAHILFTTFQDQEATAVANRIETIKPQKENGINLYLNLNLRSKDAVAHGAAVSERFNKLMEILRAKRTAEGYQPNQGLYNEVPRIIGIPVKVEVDENGKVTKAVAETKDANLKAKAEAEVSKWTVRPFSDNGTKRKMRGILSYSEVH